MLSLSLISTTSNFLHVYMALGHSAILCWFVSTGSGQLEHFGLSLRPNFNNLALEKISPWAALNRIFSWRVLVSFLISLVHEITSPSVSISPSIQPHGFQWSDSLEIPRPSKIPHKRTESRGGGEAQPSCLMCFWWERKNVNQKPKYLRFFKTNQMKRLGLCHDSRFL